MKKILLIGGGTAREHIIAKKLKENPELALFSYGTDNPGIKDLSDELKVGSLAESNFNDIVSFAKEKEIDWAFIGPDNPIGDGLSDALLQAGIKSFAPLKSLAQLESSKGFTRNLLEKYKIDGNPKYRSFKGTGKGNEKEIGDFLNELGDNFVVKYDALFGGKGVKLSGEHLKDKKEGLKYAMECLDGCGKVVIEEKLEGEEFSLMCFADGFSLVTMPTVQDHKRAYDGDTGPNTGGMGTYSHESGILPFLEISDIEKARQISIYVMQALEKECSERYKGIMYGGFIATKDGVRLIEYNARFGDPEVMNLLSLLKTDLSTICEAVIEEKLGELNIEFEKKATVCKYLAATGYPENPSKGEKISFSFNSNEDENLGLYFGGITKNESGEYIMGTSRAIAIVGKGDSISEAKNLVDKYIDKFSGNFFYRKDIGSNELIQKRIDHMKILRGQ